MPDTNVSETLKTLPFFSGLTETLLWHLGRAAERQKLAKDEILFRPGEPRSVLAIVLSGAVTIEQQQGGAHLEITTLAAGEVVGEGILLEDSNHGTFGRATMATELVIFKKDRLMKLLKDQPALYAALLGRVAKIINQRIGKANAQLLGAKSDAAQVRAQVENWIAGVTALAAKIGHEKAMAVATQAVHDGKDPQTLAREQKLL